MLSMKAKYALRALMVMAKNEDKKGKMIQSKMIASEGDIPQKFLENILLELKHHGIVDSKRGIFGGYFLAKPSSEITVGNLIRIMDGPLAPIRCASVTAYQKCDDCPNEKQCEIRITMLEVRNAISNVLDHKSISELAGIEL